MDTRQRRIARIAFVVASLLLFFAALVPPAKGEPLNVVFLSVGVVFAILGGVVGRS